jgi:hypothetical protein
MTSFSGSPEERLSAIDPMAGAPYAHSDLAGALARITATPRITKIRFVDGFRVKMGSAAAAAALVTAGGIAALGAVAPSLSVLALGQTHAPKSASLPTSSVLGNSMRIFGTDHFIVGPDLTSGTSNAAAYIVSPPSDLNVASQNVAAVLGFSGTPSTTPSVDNSWTITNPVSVNQQVDFYVSQGILNWNYTFTAISLTPGATGSSNSSSGSGTTDTTTVPDTTSTTSAPSNAPTLSNEQALSAAQGYLSSDVNQTTVQIPWVVNGVDTSNSFWFTFDGTGQLLYANGEIATISAGPVYPLLSEVDAVAVLQGQQNQFLPMLGDPGTMNSTTSPVPSDTTSTTTGGAVGSTTDTVVVPGTTPGTIPTPPVRDVTLVSATIQYGIYSLSDGTSALLPTYQFTAADGGTWTVLAVDPQYVSLASSGPMIY